MLILLISSKTRVRLSSSPQIYLSMVILLIQLADLNKKYLVIWKSYRILHLISQDRAEVAHVAHNHKVGGSNPSPATNKMIGWSHQIIKPIEWPIQ